METNYNYDNNIYYKKFLKYIWSLVFILYTFYFISIPYIFPLRLIITLFWFILFRLSIKHIIGNNSIKHYI